MAQLSSLATPVLTLCSFFAGCLAVLQASMNIHLAETVEDPIRSSCLSFWIGSLVLLLLKLFSEVGSSRTKSELSTTLVEPEYALVSEQQSLNTPDKEVTGIQSYLNYCGGLFGAIYVTGTIFIVPYIGFSVFFVCVITGQLLSAVLIDIFGLFGSERRRIHSGRIFGLLLTITGGVLLLFAANDQHQQSIALMFALIVVSVLSGMLLPVQTAANNLLKTVKQWDTMMVSGYSFVTAAIALSVTAAASSIYSPMSVNNQHNLWWYWMGGVIGGVYVAMAVQISPLIGYATFYVAVIAGQLSLSLLSDAFGLLGPLKSSARSPMAICGVLIAACGAFLVSYFKAHQVTHVNNDETIASDDPIERDYSMYKFEEKI